MVLVSATSPPLPCFQMIDGPPKHENSHTRRQRNRFCAKWQFSENSFGAHGDVRPQCEVQRSTACSKCRSWEESVPRLACPAVFPAQFVALLDKPAVAPDLLFDRLRRLVARRRVRTGGFGGENVARLGQGTGAAAPADVAELASAALAL